MKAQDYSELDKQFYPTPPELAQYVKGLAPKHIRSVLDPSAGKGNLLDAFGSHVKKYAVEIDPNLRAILESKKINIIGFDWMAYDGTDVFDAIVMNPPFRSAEKHFLKALDLCSLTSTFIVCIMNANTARVPSYAMQKAIKDYDLKVEYREFSFSEAERKTDVEIAIVYGSTVVENRFDHLIDEMDIQEEIDDVVINQNGVDKHQKVDIHRLHDNYKKDVHNAKQLVGMYKAFRAKAGDVGIDLAVDGNSDNIMESAVLNLRSRYWSELMKIESFAKHMTSKDAWALRDFLSKHKGIDFTLDNIYSVLQELLKEASSNVENTVIKLFDSITNRHAYRGVNGGNVHLYDGWKTNQGFKVKDRFIYPLSYRGLNFSAGGFSYDIEDTLCDIELCFSYFTDDYERVFVRVLDKKYVDHLDFERLTFENELFHIKFYQKGTAHITVKDKDALRRFNIFCGEKLNMLPPSYGKKSKDDMTEEELKVVKEFDGKNYKQENREILRLM